MKPQIFNLDSSTGVVSLPPHVHSDDTQRGSIPFLKSAIDKAFALAALPLIAAIALVLYILNPFFNPGPVFFRQDRMGQGGTRFRIWKFRTMEVGSDHDLRAHDAPVEEARITRLGAIMRRMRLDELPNFINVLRGDMSLVGPRPDAWDHSVRYIGTVPYYAHRFRLRPGITGLAQVLSGYADCERSIRRKARYDSFYVSHLSARLDVMVLWWTLRVVLNGFGAK